MKEMELMLEFFSQFAELDENEVSFLEEGIQFKTYEKNEFLLRQNEISSEFYFIINGCIRLFYDVDGDEKTAFFYQEKEFVSSYESFTQRKASNHYLQACESTRVAIITNDFAMQLLQQFPKFEKLARILMEKELSVLQKVISTFVINNPEQRYRLMLEEQPELVQRIAQHQLASYIGVSAETLSRIRKRIAAKDLS